MGFYYVPTSARRHHIVKQPLFLLFFILVLEMTAIVPRPLFAVILSIVNGIQTTGDNWPKFDCTISEQSILTSDAQSCYGSAK